MRCVALQHLEHDPPGLLGLPLRERGWSLEVMRVDGAQGVDGAESLGSPGIQGNAERTGGRAQPLDGLASQAVDLASHVVDLASPAIDLLLVLGGNIGAYETDRLPFLAPEIAKIGERLRAGLPVLGICLGAQLMAAALGARVYKGQSHEIGWLPVTPTAEGEADPVFPLLLHPSPVTLQWHGDTFDHPVGTVALGTSTLCAAQGFRLGAHSYALQFHPEVPLADLPTWIERSEPPLTGPPDTPWPSEIIAGAEEYYAAYERQTHAFMHAYLEMLERGRARDGPS
jgi:GMP synthase-like glutamine amidotransferase